MGTCSASGVKRGARVARSAPLTHREITLFWQVHHEDALGLLGPRDVRRHIRIQLRLKVRAPPVGHALANLQRTRETRPQRSAATGPCLPVDRHRAGGRREFASQLALQPLHFVFSRLQLPSWKREHSAIDLRASVQLEPLAPRSARARGLNSTTQRASAPATTARAGGCARSQG